MSATVETRDDDRINLGDQCIDRIDHFHAKCLEIFGVLWYTRMAAFDIGASARKRDDHLLFSKQSGRLWIVPEFCKSGCM